MKLFHNSVMLSDVSETNESKHLLEACSLLVAKSDYHSNMSEEFSSIHLFDSCLSTGRQFLSNQ